MADNSNEAKEQMAKAIISICADCWLKVFNFLAPSQLGLEIALVSSRFDCFVDEHFKTRKWALRKMRIWHKIGENGTKQMQIVNSDGKPLPIPQNALPSKVLGFEGIRISYIDHNVVAFLNHFRHLFTACCGTNLAIEKISGRFSVFALPNIWPMLKHNICSIVVWSAHDLCRLRQQCAVLSDCPALRSLTIGHFSPEFPATDDNANASNNGQALAKWLFPMADNNNGPPKLLRCHIHSKQQWSAKMEGFKTAFVNASSSANFIVVFSWRPWAGDTVVPFELTNKLSGNGGEELMTLKQYERNRFLLVRCPLLRDQRKWAEWEREAKEWRFEERWNKIDISVNEEDVADFR